MRGYFDDAILLNMRVVAAGDAERTITPDNLRRTYGGRQAPPQRGLPDPMSDFIRSGKWKEGYDASNKMLDEHAKKYNLEDQDWRKGYWDE